MPLAKRGSSKNGDEGDSVTSIYIENLYTRHKSIGVGLVISAPGPDFPLVVGCSIRTHQGQIVDIPARRISSSGRAFWTIEAPDAAREGDSPFSGWSGYVIFALWGNEAFDTRLADTGWVHWHAPWMIGASTKGLDMQDDEIWELYGTRRDALQPL